MTIYTGTNGNDNFDGNSGSDQVTFSGNAAGYRVELINGFVQVVDIDNSNGNTGTDLLTGIETLAFADRSYALGGEPKRSGAGETQVNTYTTSTQQYSAVTALSDGGYVVTWSSFAQDGDSYGIYAQRYDADGLAVGRETQVNTFSTSSQISVATTSLADGGYVITWSSYGQDAANYGIYAQRYDADGEKAGAETLINTDTDTDQIEPDIAALADGGYVITWSSFDQDGQDYGVYAQRYDEDGNRVDGEIQVNTLTDSTQVYSSIAGLTDGGYVITWQTAELNGLYSVYSQRYDADGDTVGAETPIGSPAPDQWRPDITGLADGGYVVTWSSFGQDGEGWGVYAQRYDVDGDPVGGETLVNTTTANDQLYLAITALTDGGYVIVWESFEQDGWGPGIYAQRYAADGSAAGSETRINTRTDDWQEQPNIAALADGGYVITWTSYGQDGDDRGIYAQRFDADGNAVVGGLEITGTATNDVLNGGEGIQTLIGLAGNDTLNGGAGIDTLIGGAGNDTYVLSNLDTIVEGVGGGNDLVRSAVTYILASNIENLTLTGAAAINGTGNASNNVITGNSLNNVLNGGAGVDQLIGGLGNDTYVLALAGDLIVEVANGGVDTVLAAFTYTLGATLENLTLTGAAVANGVGNALNNVITGNNANNILNAGAGNDTLNGGAGIDQLFGGLGNDTYVLAAAGDTIVEAVNGGTDTVRAAVSYTLGATLENLTLIGAAVANGLGNALNNSMLGNTAINSLNAGAGNDILDGGLGNDTLIGGTGNDRFVFSTARGATNIDRLTDFNAVADTIVLDNDIYTGLVVGALNVQLFWAGAAAHDANDRVIYNAGTGALFYDTNGNVAGGAIQIATLTPGTVITAADFVVIE